MKAPAPTKRGPSVTKKIPNPVDRHVGSRVRMRRLMLGISQTKLGEKLGLTFQQVQKYEKGTNRMGSSRLHQTANILKVPVTFFFEDAPGQLTLDGNTPSPTYVSDFLATKDGLTLTKAFTQIKDATLRRVIVDLVGDIAAMVDVGDVRSV